MPSRPRPPKPNRAERDELIVREAGPWHGDEYYVVCRPRLRRRRSLEDWEEIGKAAARILNRITRKQRGAK
jgi:hypothetical protein